MLGKLKVVVTIEARMSSTRLPNKVLLPFCGKSNLEHIIERVSLSKYIDEIVVATTTNSKDDLLVEHLANMKCKIYRGSEEDVLQRVLDAAESVNADIIVEICGDCPLVDWGHIDEALENYATGEYDYINNILSNTYPIGLAVQVFSVKLLSDISKLTLNPADREHVTLYIYSNPTTYRILSLEAKGIIRRPEIQLTLDTIEDYDFISSIYENLYKGTPISINDVIIFLEENPELLSINHKVKRKDPFEERARYE